MSVSGKTGVQVWVKLPQAPDLSLAVSPLTSTLAHLLEVCLINTRMQRTDLFLSMGLFLAHRCFESVWVASKLRRYIHSQIQEVV